MKNVFNVKMEHFIDSLGWIDNTKQIHWVPRRLFVISDDLYYPEHSHPVLDGNFEEGFYSDVTIFHLGHLPLEYLDYIQKRYKQHLKDSIIHTPEFLQQWYYSHIFGKYPTREINPLDIPTQLTDRYGIDKDMFYHSRYQLELKNVIMVQQWNDYFKPESVLDLGCGRGCYLYFWNWFAKCSGIELSKFARENSFIDKTFIKLGNVSSEHNYEKSDLIIAIDILEHLTKEELDITLRHMQKYGNKFLFSIPFIGDPNLLNDSTHIIKEDKEWWVKKLSEYFIIKSAPTDWLFHEQMLIGKQK